jgi:5-methylcytosine-specific restriction endonuclease McrA
VSKAWRKGSTRDWRKKRARVLLRDRGLCQIRLPGEWVNHKGQRMRCQVQADCVHHIKGKGVSEADEDLQAACTPCNGRVGNPGRHSPQPKRISRW